tara:strand:+ start:3314 stop:5026 length:1713 start_codon:yes stop_codon:yes gene_type:complete
MPDSYINLSQTDFNQVRNSLVDFMKTKSEFTDFDFSGSAMSTLIDLLSYNTAFFSTYTNFLANESFIDSAQKRDSLVSLARLVGYTPRSRIAARADINVTLNTGSLVPAGTIFNGQDTSFSFIVKEDIDLGSDTGTITVYQNSSSNTTKNTTYFNGSVTVPEQADISSLKVTVGGVVFSKADRISVLSASSQVFFVDAIYSGAYEVSFGDGVYGVSVPANSDVVVEYLTPNGVNNANGETRFDIAPVTSPIKVTKVNSVINSAYGGQERETIESIRRNAPSYFQAQNRAVTAEDAEIVFKIDNPEVFDATAWGGEDNNPPQYGRLFLACTKDNAGTTFTQEQLSVFAAKLQEKTVVGILPEFVQPTCYDLDILEGEIIFDRLVSIDGNGLNAIVGSKIRDYDPACGFRGIFPYSTIISDLVNNNKAIRSVDFKVEMSATFLGNEYQDNTDRNLYVSFANKIIKSTVNGKFSLIGSDIFEEADEGLGYIEDDGDGFLRFYIMENATRKYINYRIGTVDYLTGNLYVVGLTDWNAAKNKNFVIRAEPNTKSVQSRKQATFKIGVIDQLSVNA